MYTEKALLDGLRMVAKSIESDTLRYCDVANAYAKYGIASVYTYEYRFGSVRQAVQMAGLKWHESGKHTGRRYSAEEVIDCLRALDEELGGNGISFTDINDQREVDENFPTIAKILSPFKHKSLRQVVEAAGVTYVYRKKRKSV
jgi:hypothetical protein